MEFGPQVSSLQDTRPGHKANLLGLRPAARGQGCLSDSSACSLAKLHLSAHFRYVTLFTGRAVQPRGKEGAGGISVFKLQGFSSNWT